MLVYILKFSACLAIFMVFYKLVLEKENMHTFKRFYLLAAIGLAIGIPLITFIEYIEPLNTLGTFQPQFMESVFSAETEQIQEVSVNYLPYVLWSIYGLGVLFFGIKFALNLNRIHHKIKHNPKRKINVFTNVLLKDLISPHTFFNYIFLNRYKFESNEIPEEVFIHEQAHATQKHSIDVLIIELLQVIFWFNPLLYLVKKDIKLNHEFLADKAVLNNGISTSTYQEILLAFSASNKSPELVNAINYSSIKKRFTVMKTKTSKRSLWLRSLLLLPLLAILLYSFSNTVVIEKETPQELLPQEKEQNNSILIPEKYINVRPQYVIDEASDTMMKEYNDWMKRLNNNSSSLFIPVGTFERLVAIYDLMSEDQRNSVETHPFFQENPNLYKVEPSIPTTAQFESWKNEKEFAIRLDGKHISNSELNNYKINDIAHYVGSSVHSNAKSKKFAQPFQFSLYTKDGFNKFYKEVYVSDYRALTKTYSNAINTYLKGSQTDNSELRIIKAQADKFYNQFTKEEIKTYNILPTPPVPAQKKFDAKSKKEKGNFSETSTTNHTARSISIKVLNNGTYEVDDIKATKKTFVSVINQLHQDITPEIRNKIINIHVSSETDISDKEVWFIYNSVIDYGFHRIVTYNQEIIREKGNKPFAITNADYQQKATPKQVAEYNRLSKHINSQPKDQLIIKLKDLERLKYLYSIMSDTQKKNAEPFPNIPPPPPPPTKAPQYKNGKKLTLNEIIKKTPKNVESGYEMLENGESHYFTVDKGEKTYYNKDGYITNSKGKVLPPPPPAPPKPKQIIEVKNIPSPETPQNNKNKSGPNSPSNFIQKPNDTGTFIFSNFSETQQKEKKVQSTMSEDQKKQLSYRKLILHASKLLDHKPTYKIEGQSASIDDVYTFINDYPQSSVKTIQNSNENLTLSFTNSNGKKMSYNELQAVYTKVFNMTNSSNHNLSQLQARKKPKDGPNAINEEKAWNSVRKAIKSVTENSIMINGKTLINSEITLTKDELLNSYLSLKTGKITSFSIKIVDKPTQKIYGNTLNNIAKSFIKDLETDDIVQFIDLKSTENTNTKYIIVHIKA